MPGIHLVGTLSKTIFIWLLICTLIAPGLLIHTLTNKSTDKNYAEYEKKYNEDQDIKTISSVCYNKNCPECEINCIATIIRQEYNYTSNHKGIQSPTETLEKGGVCRDYALTYSMILKRLEWSVQYIHIPNHTFIVANKKNIYCTIDMTIINCAKVKT